MRTSHFLVFVRSPFLVIKHHVPLMYLRFLLINDGKHILVKSNYMPIHQLYLVSVIKPLLLLVLPPFLGWLNLDFLKGSHKNKRYSPIDSHGCSIAAMSATGSRSLLTTDLLNVASPISLQQILRSNSLPSCLQVSG